MTKQETIEEIMKNSSEPMTVKSLAKKAGTTVASISSEVKRMQDECLIECVGMQKKEHLYLRTRLLTVAPSRGACWGGIGRAEIRKVKEKSRHGYKVIVRNNDGSLSKEIIDSIYPNHCRMKSGCSYTWIEMAMFNRLGRILPERGGRIG